MEKENARSKFLSCTAAICHHASNTASEQILDQVHPFTQHVETVQRTIVELP